MLHQDVEEMKKGVLPGTLEHTAKSEGNLGTKVIRSIAKECYTPTIRERSEEIFNELDALVIDLSVIAKKLIDIRDYAVIIKEKL